MINIKFTDILYRKNKTEFVTPPKKKRLDIQNDKKHRGNKWCENFK